MTEISRQGTLVLVVGPSGAGKDTIIEGVRQELLQDAKFLFPQRHITRPEDSGGEAHFAISRDEFLSKQSSGRYSFSWEAHGNLYGIPASIEHDIINGKTVVLNVSRTIIAEARRKFDHTAIFNVTAAIPVLRERLQNRGRETSDDIARRLERASAYKITGIDVTIIENNASVETSVNLFLNHLRKL
ncbi:MAG: phosphonate metabolism protein/1,5-bisphosphokinase (PRPP-forming) PhnN [Proteobacteria bacterium]|nr:phosphonate metabolism protein/1,5-bisphosphokinase (PRPP-forming) PhnN [Pseudomonadota bacterium]